ncbi:MAG: RNA polymerase sigma factor [Actinomycetota bacterium]
MDESDAALAARLLQRDEGALREVIARHGGVVLGMARRVVADASLAEEVAQDTFLALWRRPGSYDRGRGTLRGFLLGVARNKAIDRVRREESLRRATDALIAESDPTSGEASSTELMDRMDERQIITRALGTLSAVQREVIVLAYFGGRTYREVASELGIPEGTAKTRMRDGLIKLRRVMEGTEGWTERTTS